MGAAEQDVDGGAVGGGVGADQVGQGVHQEEATAGGVVGVGWAAVLIDLRSRATEAIVWCQRGRKEGWLGPVPVVPVVETWRSKWLCRILPLS